MSNYINNKKNIYIDALYPYKNSNRSGKISHVGDDGIEMIRTRPKINK